MSYLYIAATIALTVFGQLVIKWRVVSAGPFPEAALEQTAFLARMFMDPWVISGLLAAVLASVAWMAALTKLPLSHAYPFMSGSFVLVLIFSGLLFQEPISTPKIVGLGLIVVGIAVGSQG